MKILGVSGKKQAGKNTICSALFGQHLCNKGLIERWHIHEGELQLEKEVDHPNLIYSFADVLKEVCLLFGLSEEMVWGNDEQKNQLTHIMWDDMPLFSMNDVKRMVDESGGRPVEFKRTGPMTAREFMQVLGTDVCRRIYDPIWINALSSRLELDNPEIALICDVRFPNEVKKIEEMGGKVIRLTRNPHKDEHSGELALDSYPFSLVLDNKDMTVDEQNFAAYAMIKDYLFD
jgi:hypothetical protein